MLTQKMPKREKCWQKNLLDDILGGMAGQRGIYTVFRVSWATWTSIACLIFGPGQVIFARLLGWPRLEVAQVYFFSLACLSWWPRCGVAQEVYIFQFASFVAKLLVGPGLPLIWHKTVILYNMWCCSVYILYVIQLQKRETCAFDDLTTLLWQTSTVFSKFSNFEEYVKKETIYIGWWKYNIANFGNLVIHFCIVF